MPFPIYGFRQRGTSISLNPTQTRPKVITEFPNIEALDVMKVIGKRWQELDEKGREYFKEVSERDRIRFNREQELYSQSITQKKPQEKSTPVNKRTQKQLRKHVKTSKMSNNDGAVSFNTQLPQGALAHSKYQARREIGVPKKPLSAYIYYSQKVTFLLN